MAKKRAPKKRKKKLLENQVCVCLQHGRWTRVLRAGVASNACWNACGAVNCREHLTQTALHPCCRRKRSWAGAASTMWRLRSRPRWSSGACLRRRSSRLTRRCGSSCRMTWGWRHASLVRQLSVAQSHLLSHALTGCKLCQHVQHARNVAHVPLYAHRPGGEGQGVPHQPRGHRHHQVPRPARR